MFDDLHKPLGLDRPPPQRKRAVTLPRVLLSLALTLVLSGSVATALYQPPFSGAGLVAQEDGATAQVASVESRPLPAIDDASSPQPEVRPASGLPADMASAGSAPVGAPNSGIVVRDPGSLRQPEGLRHRPDDGLIEESAFGPLPVRGEDGRRPFDVYAGESSGIMGRRIAIVVGGLGISQTGTQAALRALPPDVTLAFAPSGNSLDRWMQAARRDGHEVLLQVPLESVGYPQVSPGRYTLLAADAVAGEMDDLYRALGRMTNYVGIMNYMGAAFTANEEAMSALAAELGRRGLMYLDDATGRSVARQASLSHGVPFAASDLTIDADRDPAAIRAQLDTLERIARAEGSAIGVASAFDISVAAIADWVGEVQQRGIEVVPVSALALDPQSG